MLYWGKLNSTGNDSSHQEIHGFDQMFRATSITEVSITEGLATYLRDPGRKVTVVTSHKRNRKQPPYQREFLFIISRTLFILCLEISPSID